MVGNCTNTYLKCGKYVENLAYLHAGCSLKLQPLIKSFPHYSRSFPIRLEVMRLVKSGENTWLH